ncbi:hypothetical protein AGMMS49975_22860 [Clostridia bacterium]|nr:hypothetical protein AGMMS49975_22860 [Clostridia bacterium]
MSNIIEYNDVETLIPIEHAQDIIGGVAQRDTVNGSVALKLGKRLPDMTSRQKEIPNLSLMAFAYLNEGQTFNEQDTYLRRLSKSAWNNVMLTAQEIYCFVPISKNSIADSNYRVWDNVKEQIVQRLGAALDEAILFGAAGVAGIPPSIYERCVTSGNVIDYGDIGDIYDDALGTGGLVNLIEEQDYSPNGYVAKNRVRSFLRGLRNAVGTPIFSASPQSPNNYTLDGHPILFPNNGVLQNHDTLMIAGDWSNLVYAIRQDIEYQLLDQATLRDPQTTDTYYLAQQNMVALKVIMRVAWNTINPISAGNGGNALRYPFAVLKEQTGS